MKEDDVLKIAMLAPEIFPSWGGVGSYTYNLVQNLPDHVDVHLITIDRSATKVNEKDIWGSDVTIHKITNISSKESFFYNVKFQISVLMKLKKINKIYGFDLIHSHSGHLPHIFSQFQKIAPIIVTVHTETKGLRAARKKLEFDKDTTEFFNDFFSPFIELSEKISFQKSDRLLPISKFTLNQIKHLYKVDVKNKAKVIYNGVNTDLFKPINNKLNNPKVITFIGRLYSLKGIEFLIKSISKIREKGYIVNLNFVGRGNKANLRKYCSLYLDKKSYSIIGHVPYEKMPEIINMSDIIILPSVYEGCSGVILEGLSCGKIVIASDVGGTPEIIKDNYNGLLFKSQDSNELIKKIILVLDEKIDIKSIKRNARKTAIEKFDWKNIAQQVYNEYLKVL